MSTFYRDLEPVSKQATIVIGLTVVGFMTVGLAISFYRNVLFEDTLRNMRLENNGHLTRVEESRADLDYYRSREYKDKYAKQNLGKLNAGEKVLIISEPTANELLMQDAPTVQAKQQAVFEEQIRNMPVLEHWQLFLLHRDKLEKLRGGV